MRLSHRSLFLIFCFISLPGSAAAWVNGDFETGDSTGWIFSTNNPTQNPNSTVAVVPAGPAPDTNGNLNQAHGGAYAVQIFSGAGDINHGDWARVSQSDVVPAGSACLSVWFAAVVNGIHYTSGEPYGSDSYVQLDLVAPGPTTVYDQRFSWYDNSTQLVDDGYSDVEEGVVIPWKHLPWTRYYYDLSAYVGQPVTLFYSAYDCDYSAHYAWGYLDDLQWISCALVPTATPTPTLTLTWTPTATFTPTWTLSPTPTWTLSPTPTFTLSPTQTPTVTLTRTLTPTLTPTVTLSPTETLTSTWTLSPTPTSTVTDTPTNTPTETPCGYPGLTCTPTWTPTFTPTFTPTCPIHLWPNPYNRQFAFNHTLKFTCVPEGSMVEFYTVSGELVDRLQVSGYGTWDGRNQMGQFVSDGIYYYVIRRENQVFARGKLLIVKDR